MDAAAQRYLEIVLRLARLEPGLVESDAAPPQLARRIEAEPPPSAPRLRAETEALRGDLKEETDRDRRAWLSGQLSGIETLLADIEGERIGYRRQVERCYGVIPARVPESQFAAAHERLAEALPGAGDVRVRYRSWIATQQVPHDRLLAALNCLAAELRARTRDLVALPADERVAFELAVGEHWAGNADYLGACHTRIRINKELPISAARLLELVAHEAYPGHHTEAVCKDVDLVQGRGRSELSVYVYTSPQALVAEGIAMLAREALLGDQADEIAASALRPLGIPYEADVAAVAREAETMLVPVRANIAMLLDDGWSEDEVREYAQRWMLDSDDNVEGALRSLKARRWKAIESCYPEGLALCKRFAAGDPGRFARLLREQLTTEALL